MASYQHREGMARRGFLRVAGIAGAASLAAAACTPTAAPAPASPSQPVSPTKAAWENEWDKLAAAAKQEGKLVILYTAATGFREAPQAFGKEFGIEVEAVAGGSSAAMWIPKIRQERAAGIYSFDVATVPPNSAISQLGPEGAWESVRSALFRPDILDDKVWTDSFDERFMDKNKQTAFAWEYNVYHSVWVDTDVVKPGEITTAADLLAPKWKGKIISADVRTGSIFIPVASLRLAGKDAVIKPLLADQEPTYTRDSRALAEGVVRKRFPIGFGIQAIYLKEYLDQGVANHVKHLDIPELDYIPSYSVFLFNRAPHPNAAKLFLNWFLTKEGQTTYAKTLPTNSARKDVNVFDPSGAGTPGKKYFISGREQNSELIDSSRKIATDAVGIQNVS